jgi:hypothetical protein
LLICAGGVAAFGEPLYDLGFKLLFFTPGQWTLFTYDKIPQPVWTVSGYVTLYSGPAIFICERLARGIDAVAFWKWAGFVFLASATFEIVGIQGQAYTYWGPHAFRIFGYPLAVAVLETTFVMVFSVLANEYRRSIPAGWGLIGLFALFPGTFYFINFGIGAPVLVAIGLSPSSPGLVAIASLASIGAALCILAVAARWAAQSAGPASASAAHGELRRAACVP